MNGWLDEGRFLEKRKKKTKKKGGLEAGLIGVYLANELWITQAITKIL